VWATLVSDASTFFFFSFFFWISIRFRRRLWISAGESRISGADASGSSSMLVPLLVIHGVSVLGSSTPPIFLLKSSKPLLSSRQDSELKVSALIARETAGSTTLVDADGGLCSAVSS